MTRAVRLLGLVGAVVVASLLANAPSAHADRSPVPVLAYYYIWFDPGSWERAKSDYPLLGRYSSDDENVMRQHVRWAKAAGIEGFIVSWKSTPKLDERLDKLISVAESENFKLLIIYEGLDFNRNPLTISQIDSDLDYFIRHFANRAPFRVFDKPVFIWSGTWEFSHEDIARLSAKYRDQVLLLATAKNIKSYEEIADLVDGNAYYWSSVNPQTNATYESKLGDMAQAIHRHHGLWIAPAAPGFDARKVGGTSVVERQNGDTLRRQMNAAVGASPDAIGIISWNEFSENTYIEPSQKYGDLYLNVLADIQETKPPAIPDFDSSDPQGRELWPGWGRMAGLIGLASAILLSFAVIVRRQLIRH